MIRKLFLILLTAAALLPPAAGAEEPVKLPILMYHDVRWEDTGKDAVTPEELESDLRWLTENGYTAVTLGRVLAYVQEGEPLPEKPVVLSFDDGYFSAYDRVLPLLREAQAPMVLSVIAGSADEFSAYAPGKRRPAHAAWEQLRSLCDSGLCEVQNHSYALHGGSGGVFGCDRRPGEGRGEYEERLALDALRAQERIWEETGFLPCAFTYPYGRYSELSEELLRELGFRATLTCDFGVNLVSRDPACLYRLKRICRSHGADLAALMAEAYDTLKWR